MGWGFDIQLKSAMRGIKKIREHGINISEQNTINSCLVVVRLAGHSHAIDTPGFGCPANANQCPALPKHSLYLLIQQGGKSFSSPCGLLPQPRTHSAVSSPASPLTTFRTGCFAFILPVLLCPFLHYDFFVVIING